MGSPWRLSDTSTVRREPYPVLWWASNGFLHRNFLLRRPVRSFRRRIRASDGLSELPMAYQSFEWPVGSLDGPSEALIRHSKVPTGCRKLSWAVRSLDKLSEALLGHRKL